MTEPYTSDEALITERQGWLRSLVTRVMRRIPLLAGLDAQLQEVAGGAAVALALRVIGAGLAFGFNIILARLIGPAGTGIYYQALAIVLFGAVVGQLGLENALLRFVAAHANQGDWGAVRHITRKGLRAAGAVSTLLVLVVAVGARPISILVFSDPQLTEPLRLMALAILPFTLNTLFASMLRAIDEVEASMLVSSVFVPLFSSVLLLFLARPLGVNGVALAYVAATLITLLSAALFWRRAAPQVRHAAGSVDTSILFASAMPLLWVTLLSSVQSQVDVVLLGTFADSGSVGIYGAAKRVATLTSLILVAVNIIVAPRFAALHAQGEHDALRTLAQNVTTLMALLAVPILLPFVLAPGWIMRLFGPEFSSGGVVLLVLALGQFVNMATGSVGYLLMMTGHEKALRSTVIVSTAALVLLSLLLIPLFGTLGAAIATAVSMALHNIMAAVLVYKKLSIIVLSLDGFRKLARGAD